MRPSESDFIKCTIQEQIQLLYAEGTFIVSIRYYGYKVNLYLLGNFYVEVFYNHKHDRIEKIELLDFGHSRMKFYHDQISLASLAS